jgi:hypothetical protein
MGLHIKAAGLAKNPPPTPDKSVVDLVLEDAKKLKKQVGRADQQKLEQYLTAVRDIEERMLNQKEAVKERIITREITKGISETRRAIRNAFKDSGQDDLSVVPRIPYRDYGRLLMDVMALAFWTNSTRVSTLMFGTGSNGTRNMSFLEGVDGNHHTISHHGGKTENLEMFTRVNIFFMEQYAYFLQKLKGFEEGASNVLENSIVLLGSNMGDGQKHSGTNIPIIVAGRGGGRIRTGRHIRTNGHTAQIHRSVLDTMNLKPDFAGGTGQIGAFKS